MPLKNLSSAAWLVFADTNSTLPSISPVGARNAKSSIQETAMVRLNPVQGTVACAEGLKEVGEGVFKAG